MTKKIICIAMVLLMLFVLCGCGDDFAKDRVVVMIKSDYQKQFEDRTITEEDFSWDNVDYIEYATYSDCMIIVFLKKQSRKRVLDAVKYFNTLEFVYSATPSYYYELFS